MIYVDIMFCTAYLKLGFGILGQPPNDYNIVLLLEHKGQQLSKKL